MLETKHNITLKSETDTEAIAHLVGLELDKGGEGGLQEAVVNAMKRCDGTWAIAVMSKDNPDEIVVSALGSPIVIGVGENSAFIGSEHIAFNRYCNNIIRVGDGETVSVKAGSHHGSISGTFEKVEKEDILLTPHPYPHWTLKEINEQSEAAMRAMGNGGRLRDSKVHLGGLDRNRDKFANVSNLLMVGCGTSLNAALFGKKLMDMLDSVENVQAEDAAETVRASLPKPENGALLAISQSGETKDVVRTVKLAEEAGIIPFSVINNVGSLIARLTRLGIYLNAGRENGVAATKTFVSSVSVLALLAYWFRELRESNENLIEHPLKNELYEALQRLPIHVGMMATQCRERCKQIAEEIQHKEHCFILGKVFSFIYIFSEKSL